MTKTLKNFLKEHNVDHELFSFAKDMTLEEFLAQCNRGDWILSLFQKMNPNYLKELTLVKAHCANTVRHLMKDERSLKAVDEAIAFGEGKITEIDNSFAAVASAAFAAADDAFAAAATDTAFAARAAAAAAFAAFAAAAAADAAANARASDASAFAANAAAAEKESLKQTADMCRKYLNISLWDQSKIN